MKTNYANKKLIVFDLDGTLAESKTVMDKEMTALMEQLLAKKKVAVIGGGRYQVFKMQLTAALKGAPRDLLKNLYLFPTTSTAFYHYDRGWKNVYTLTMSKEEKAKIRKAFKETYKEAGYVHPKKTYGVVLEDRVSQMTFSALGQDVVKVLGKEGLRLKEKWKKENTPIKLKMAKILAKKLPTLEVHSAAFTSIDITRKGIDKAYGVRQIEKHLHVPIKNMIFIGDALYPGGNDYAAKKSGIQTLAVKNPEDTKRVIKEILK